MFSTHSIKAYKSGLVKSVRSKFEILAIETVNITNLLINV